MLKLSRYVVASDCMRRLNAGTPERVVFSTRSGAVYELPEAVWKSLEAGRCNELPDRVTATLVNAKILVASDEDELRSVVDENLGAIADNDVLYQVVQPTAWCQLGCGYCGQAHSKRKLSAADQRTFLERTERKLAEGQYRELSIGWFGAEPLLGLSVIRDLSPRLIEMANRHSCAYSSRMVTNGAALSPEIASELVQQHRIAAAEITLDGLGTLHDAKRPMKSGAPTFDRIFANLRAVAAADSGLAITIRCNVDRNNAEGVPRLIEALAAEGLAGRIEFYTSPVYAWGNDADKVALPPAEYAALELEWLALQVRLGFRANLLPARRKIVCLSVQRDAELVDAMGGRFNCTEVPYVPAFGEPNIYAYDPDSTAADSPPGKLRHFNSRLLGDELPSCSACPMLPVCGGQCPKAWLEGTAPCPPPKYNIRERLNVLYALSHSQQGDPR
jgi:uncharacterized protein